MSELWWFMVGAGAILAVFVLVWRPARAASRHARLSRAKRDFHLQRERLEAKFVQLAKRRSRGDSPHWEDCDFDDDVAYVRDRNSRKLSAFVAVTVAVSEYGGPLASIGDVLGNYRVGTAVFRFDRDHWDTDGRAILNLSPAEAIRFYQNDLEIVDQEMASSTRLSGPRS